MEETESKSLERMSKDTDFPRAVFARKARDRAGEETRASNLNEEAEIVPLRENGGAGKAAPSGA